MYVSVSRSRSTDPRAHKYFSKIKVGTLAAMADVMLSGTWSPILWHGDARARANFLSCKYAAFDFDNGEFTVADAAAWCAARGLGAIIGTSKSHQIEKVSGKSVKPPCDRFRLVVPFAKVIVSRDVYEGTMRAMMDVLPTDDACTDAARFFWRCTKIISATAGGGLEVAEDVAAAHERPLAPPPRDGEPWPYWVTKSLNFGVGGGARHKTVYRLGATLVHLGYDEEQITAMVMRGPLGEIGEADVRRAVGNGAAAGRCEMEANKVWNENGEEVQPRE